VEEIVVVPARWCFDSKSDSGFCFVIRAENESNKYHNPAHDVGAEHIPTHYKPTFEQETFSQFSPFSSPPRFTNDITETVDTADTTCTNHNQSKC